eukprot:TRINITY_DN7060_c0_g1_i1.p1 TRINITY_DN7060_c0_g1~~TRINITY_DN7060_c0_g1_i1.p1  ORF type:complete len:240 (+),score=72.51 TRINITY_DN7060_c0_g1_i1:23-721(+)
MSSMELTTMSSPSAAADPVLKQTLILTEMFPTLDPSLIELLVQQQLQQHQQQEPACPPPSSSMSASADLNLLIQQCLMLTQAVDEDFTPAAAAAAAAATTTAAVPAEALAPSRGANELEEKEFGEFQAAPFRSGGGGDDEVGISIAQSLLDEVSNEIFEAEKKGMDLEAIEPAVADLMKYLHSLSAKECRVALKTIVHCLSKVLDNPSDETFRVLKLSNDAFRERVGRFSEL